MSKIFISYRRSDSEDVTGRIFDHLSQDFERDNIFKDVDSILPGTDYRTAITNTLQSCDVMIVVIGRGWLKAKNRKGTRRLDDPNDYVRLEIEGAVNRKIPIIPVLVGGTEIPALEALPVSLQPLVFQNAIPVRPDPDFISDVGKLVRALRSIVKGNGLLHRIRRLRQSRWLSSSDLEGKGTAESEKRSGLPSKITIVIVLALIVVGTSLWWRGEVFWRREEPNPPKSASPELSPSELTGTWIVDDGSSIYEVKLTQLDNRVTGLYPVQRGSIDGNVQGNKLSLEWDQPDNRRGGTGELTIAADGNRMIGSWSYNPQKYDSGLTGRYAWTFSRKR